MNEYNFDPMTGKPISKKEAQPDEAFRQPEADEPRPEETSAGEEKNQGVYYNSSEQNSSQEQDSSHPTAEQPVYHYARPQNEWADTSFVPPASSYDGYAKPQETKGKHHRKERVQQPVTAGKLYAMTAASIVLALVLGLGGGYAGARYLAGSNSGAAGTAVIYKTTKLQDANGNTQTTTLSVEDVATLVKNSVVEITTEQIVTGSFMQQYVSEGAGSGVIITADGYIVTNNHVINGATNIKVRTADGTEYTAKLVAADSKADLAVLKIDASGLTPAAYGDSSELAVGETVIAVGNPLGELGGTVTSGIISALDREITIDDTTMNLLQTDTAINPGNSGGGMFNTSGQLVGIVNAKSAGAEIEGLGFAIPINSAKSVVEDLISKGYVTGRVNAGFTFVEVSDALTAMRYRVNDLGLYISAVASGSDGDKAGFQSGDYVVSIDGTKVSTAAEANAILDKKQVGDTVSFVIKRNNAEQTITMTLTEYAPSSSSSGT